MEEREVPRDQRASFVPHALKGPALELFHSDILGRATQIAEVYTLLEAKFLSESVKLGIRTKLLSLRIADFQIKEDIPKVEAIEKMKLLIYQYAQQGQPEYRSDSSIIDVMEKAVLAREVWSTEIAARRATKSFTYDEYCTALVTWIRATVEKGGIKNAHGYFGEPSAENTQHKPLAIMFGEQYNTRRNSSFKKSARPSPPQRKGSCRRCGKLGHWQVECPDKFKASPSHLEALQARVKDAGGTGQAVAKVLYEVGEELDATAEENSQKSDDAADIEEELDLLANMCEAKNSFFATAAYRILVLPALERGEAARSSELRRERHVPLHSFVLFRFSLTYAMPTLSSSPFSSKRVHC
jgi:Zinc knuckle